MRKGEETINKQLSYGDILRENVEEEERLYGFVGMDKETLELHDEYERALGCLYPECDDPTYKGVINDEEVADFMGIDVETLRRMRAEYETSRIVSLDEIVEIDEPILDEEGDGCVPLLETIEAPRTANGAYGYLAALMDCLSDEEYFIVCSKNGVLGESERTDGQIAKRLNIPVGEIRKIYKKALLKIKAQGEK